MNSAYDYPGATITCDRTVTVLVQTSPGIYEPANVNLVTGAYAVIATGVTGTLPALPVAFYTVAPTLDAGDAGLLPDTTLPATGTAEFTKAADDVLQALEYVHDNPVLE